MKIIQKCFENGQRGLTQFSQFDWPLLSTFVYNVVCISFTPTEFILQPPLPSPCKFLLDRMNLPVTYQKVEHSEGETGG